MTTTPWPLRSSEAFEIESQAVGDTMAVGVWRPPLHPMVPDDGQPLQLVYVLDGSFALGLAAAICQLQGVDLIRPGFPKLLLVGLDYPEARMNARTRDYCPPGTNLPELTAMMATYFDEVPPEMVEGGAAAFLEFMATELDPLIRERFDVVDGPAGLLGDSHGGTFAAFAFAEQSPLFDRYWLGSPGLFTTDADHAQRVIDTLGRELVHDTRMFLSLGQLEMQGGVAMYEDMGRHYTRIVSALQTTANDRLTWRAKLYPGHTHTSVVAPALNDALLHLYGTHFPEA